MNRVGKKSEMLFARPMVFAAAYVAISSLLSSSTSTSLAFSGMGSAKCHPCLFTSPLYIAEKTSLGN